MKTLKVGQLIRLRYGGKLMSVRSDPGQLNSYLLLREFMNSSEADTEKSVRRVPESRQLAIVLQESEEIDMDLYHKCWVLPSEGISWDGEFWFKREELEVIQPPTSDRQFLKEI